LAKANQPIGIFDSGIGGLTVANAVAHFLPNEQIIYFGDTAHLPYGDKSADAIRYYCLRIVKFLLDRHCKMIVIACNSASSAAYSMLLNFFPGDILFVNVVDPLVETVAGHQYKKVGVIATKATIRSGIYERRLHTLYPDLSVVSQATPLLVPMIEEGFFQNDISHTVLDQYLRHDGFQDIDALLLACTHYPLIRTEIDAYYNGKVKIYDSTDVVAQKVYDQLNTHQLLNPQRDQPHHFYVSDLTPSFEATTKLFYDEAIVLEHMPIWQGEFY
jgi:glutamate racemase